MSFVRNFYQSTPQYYGQYSYMQSLHYTSKKLGHDCKSRAEYWQQSGCSTVSDCKKLNASRQENNLLKLIVLFFLVQERICYAEARLHWSPAAFTATQHARIYNHIRVWLQDMTWIWSCIVMNHELLYSLCSSLIRKQSKIVCLELQLQQVAHISSDSLFQDMNTEGN